MVALIIFSCVSFNLQPKCCSFNCIDFLCCRQNNQQPSYCRENFLVVLINIGRCQLDSGLMLDVTGWMLNFFFRIYLNSKSNETVQNQMLFMLLSSHSTKSCSHKTHKHEHPYEFTHIGNTLKFSIYFMEKPMKFLLAAGCSIQLKFIVVDGCF